ncbi:MAG: CusA/CzcA family heavy metal efflux RND transporter, partial [Moraxellaceae bacterium]
AEIATDPMPPSVADNFIIMKPRSEWPDSDKSKAQIVSELEQLVLPVPGNRYEFLQPIQMRFNELLAGVRAELSVKVFGDDFDQLILLGNQVEAAMKKVSGAADVSLEQATGLPLLNLQPQHEQLARYGITLEHLQDSVAIALGGQVTTQFYEGDRRTDIVVRLPERLRTDIDKLAALPISLPNNTIENVDNEHASNNDYVPLGELVNFEQGIGYNQIYRENGKRRVVVSANVRGRDLGSFVNEVRTAVEAQVKIPAGYWIEYGGTYQQLQSASQKLMLVIPLTIVIIMALLVMALGSWRDAFIISSGIPLALTGGVLALLIRDIPFSISAAVGFIALSGIAVLNGLVMVSFIRTLRSRGQAFAPLLYRAFESVCTGLDRSQHQPILEP